MQKSTISLNPTEVKALTKWLETGHIASLGVTSEAPGYSIESALGLENGPGWRAGKHGEQLIRIVFTEAQAIHRIQLEFHETEHERTQEFALRWGSREGEPLTEIRRQQWNFSPQGSTIESEDYSLSLKDVRILELHINPDINRNGGLASLTRWRVG
jgi:hypothetical protein